MKRGFLNTEKAKAKLAAETSASNDLPVPKNKGKAKADAPADTNDPDMSHLPILDLHSSPSFKKPQDRNRFIFRIWPRDPNGKVILPSTIHGKEAANGLDLWGATLYDFFYVRRIPSLENALTISSASKLTRVMKEFGEYHAEGELAWAALEVQPAEIPAWDPAEAIVIHERRVHASVGVADKKNEEGPVVSATEPKADMEVADISKPDGDSVEAGRSPCEGDRADGSRSNSLHCQNKVSIQQRALENPVESPFRPSNYPSPWPLVPFESQCSPFALQRRIPIHLFPKKLHVHDPWKLVRANTEWNQRNKKESWTSKTDHIRTYSLSLSPEGREKAEAGRKAAIAAEDEALKTPETAAIFPQTHGLTKEPAIQVVFPPRPRKLIEVPEAHLYLSPKGSLGTGHHSVVYEADLELPRDLFCESTYCNSCLNEQVKAEVTRLKESGEWEHRLKEATEKYETSESRSPVQIPPDYVGFVRVTLEHEPTRTASMIPRSGMGDPATDDPPESFVRLSKPVTHRYVNYEGPVVPIYPNVQWQNSSLPDTLCKHEAGKKKPVPRTATFRVAAKLSLPGDPHLEHEASNYCKFPEHFFQHWNGYNVIPPLHDPVPVGALVPQFFGYYTPDDDPWVRHSRDTYSSPILLIELCGTPISVRELSTDDRHECAALLFRFHCEGWQHESFAERNILKQKQHPTCSPLEDKSECKVPHRHRPYSFRLIDFGRSLQFQDMPLPNRASEEMFGRKLFGLLE